MNFNAPQFAQAYANHHHAQANQAGPSTSGGLQTFWAQQLHEVQQVSADVTEFKNQQLPLARIKKVSSKHDGHMS